MDEETRIFSKLCVVSGGRNIVVSIATRYGLDGLVVESRWQRDFPHLSGPALGLTQPPVQRVLGIFPVGLSSQGTTLTTQLYLAPKSRAIPLLPLWVFMAYSRVDLIFFFRCSIALLLFDFSQTGPCCHILAKPSIIQFHEIFFISSQAVTYR